MKDSLIALWKQRRYRYGAIAVAAFIVLGLVLNVAGRWTRAADDPSPRAEPSAVQSSQPVPSATIGGEGANPAPWDGGKKLDTGSALPRIAGTVLPQTDDPRVFAAAIIDAAMRINYEDPQVGRDELIASLEKASVTSLKGITSDELASMRDYAVTELAGQPATWSEGAETKMRTEYETESFTSTQRVPPQVRKLMGDLGVKVHWVDRRVLNPSIHTVTWRGKGLMTQVLADGSDFHGVSQTQTLYVIMHVDEAGARLVTIGKKLGS